MNGSLGFFCAKIEMQVHVSVFSLGKTHSHTTHLHISYQNSWAGRCPDSCEHKNSFNNSFFQTKPALRLSIKVFRKWIVNNWLQVSLPIYKWSKFLPINKCSSKFSFQNAHHSTWLENGPFPQPPELTFEWANLPVSIIKGSTCLFSNFSGSDHCANGTAETKNLRCVHILK